MIPSYFPRPTMKFVLDRGPLLLELPRSDALDLLDWLGLGRPEFGAINIRKLLPLCRRRLWFEPRNVDEPKKQLSFELTVVRGKRVRGPVEVKERPAGTLRLHTEFLAAAIASFGEHDGHEEIVRFG
jgi:hypothetical protein